MVPEVLYLLLAGVGLLLAAAILKRPRFDASKVQWPTREPRPKLRQDGRMSTAAMLRTLLERGAAEDHPIDEKGVAQ